MCIKTGYTNCINSSYASHSAGSTIWWKEREDGSKHDLRSDPEYIELLDLGLERRIHEADVNMNWKEWEDHLESLEISWKKNTSPDWGCQHHQPDEVLVRINQYML
jgi:hypothetical protein